MNKYWCFSCSVSTQNLTLSVATLVWFFGKIKSNLGNKVILNDAVKINYWFIWPKSWLHFCLQCFFKNNSSQDPECIRKSMVNRWRLFIWSIPAWLLHGWLGTLSGWVYCRGCKCSSCRLQQIWKKGPLIPAVMDGLLPRLPTPNLAWSLSCIDVSLPPSMTRTNSTPV